MAEELRAEILQAEQQAGAAAVQVQQEAVVQARAIAMAEQESKRLSVELQHVVLEAQELTLTARTTQVV